MDKARIEVVRDEKRLGETWEPRQPHIEREEGGSIPSSFIFMWRPVVGSELKSGSGVPQGIG